MSFLNYRLIINADDFAGSNIKNSAITYCFEKNLINSTTIMVNTDFFDEALELAAKFDFKSKIGLHLNLTYGKPLTDLSNTGLIDENGFFLKKNVLNQGSSFSPAIKLKIRNEISEQYNKLLYHEIIPTHIDSHHHVHTLPCLQDIILEFAIKEKQKIRLANEWSRKNVFNLLKSKRLNKKFKINRINFSDKFERISTDPLKFKNLKNKQLVYEIMVHPSFENDSLIDCVDHINLEDSIIKLKQIFKV